MKLVKILKILRNDKITIDYLDYNETNMIIHEIMNNPKLIKEIEQIPDKFWEEAKHNGLLLYSDLIWTKSNSIDLSNRYQEDNNIRKGPINALVLQKKIRR